jgi:membrane protein DedA with SNARE-associated domain
MSYLALFGVVLSTVVVPLPEEVPLLAAGYLARVGALGLLPAFAVAWAAIVLGDAATFWLGRAFLSRLLRTRWGRRVVSPRSCAWAEHLVAQRGFSAIVFGRFLVALRGPVYLAIGASRYPAPRFLAANAAVALVEVGLVVGAGYAFGSAPIAGHVRAIDLAVALVILATLVLPPVVRHRLSGGDDLLDPRR